jgi:Tol biopolymer transport system component
VVDGQFSVTLEAVPAHCTVASGTTIQVTVPDNGAGHAAFQLDCPPGLLTVNSSTTGSNGGQANYRVIVDGGRMQTVRADGGSTVFSNLSNGDHTVELLDVPSPCTVLGQNPRTVTVPGVVDFGAACTSSGKILMQDRFGQSLKTMNPDGTQVEVIAGRGHWPRWSPDGSQYVSVAAPTSGCESDLVVWNADGSGSRTILTETCTVSLNLELQQPTWSHVSSELVVVVDSADYTFLNFVDLTSLQRSQVYDPFTDSIWDPEHPDWSADGNEIIFDAWTKDWQGKNIYVVSPAGGQAPRPLLATGFHVVGPRFSPDGTKFAYFRQDFSDYEDGIGDSWEFVIAKRSDGSDIAVVRPGSALGCGGTAEAQASWSPDGAQIVFGYEPGGTDAGTYLVNADGSGLVKLRDQDCHPDWQPGS